MDGSWQKVTITVEGQDGQPVVTTFHRVVGFALRKVGGPVQQSAVTDGYAVPEWTDFTATGRALPNPVGLYSVSWEPKEPVLIITDYGGAGAGGAGGGGATATGTAADRPGRTGESVLLDIPCPRCGNQHLLCYLLTDESGRHQHTHYVCTFWGSGRPVACGWHGWTVPDPIIHG